MARLDCVVIGYNDTPFEQYEALLRQYGEDTEAYRDLKMSFVDVGGRKLTFTGLLNLAFNRAHGRPETRLDGPFKSGDIPNLAAAYLTHYLRRRGFAVESINLFQDEKARFADILAERPRAVAITTTFYVINFPVLEMVRFIREHAPETKIVLGGPLVSNHARNYAPEDLGVALDDLGADLYVHDSQGEETLARILAALRDGDEVSRVPNVIYQGADGRYVHTPHQPENNDLNAEAIDWTRLADLGLGPTLQTRTARSCAFSCAFCNYPTRAGKLTLAGLDAIGRELDSMQALGARQVVFIDDTFNVPLPRFKDICRLMIDRGYGFNWYSYFRCSNSDDEAFDLMAESGCKGVFLGIESGSPRILKNMAKAATIEKYSNGIRRLRERGVTTFGSFILGFPGETRETVEETAAFLRDNPMDYYRAQLWYNEPGTPIHEKREQYGTQGDGFVWNHATMDSLEGMEHIERLFLTLDGPTWLPQWSFDFWILPYFQGLGISLPQLRDQLRLAHKALALEVADLSREEHDGMQAQILGEMVRNARSWNLEGARP